MEIKLFIKSLKSNKTCVYSIPKDFYVDDLLEKLDAQATAYLAVNGKTITGTAKISQLSLNEFDTLHLIDKGLLGGSQEPLIEKRRSAKARSRVSAEAPHTPSAPGGGPDYQGLPLSALDDAIDADTAVE